MADAAPADEQLGTAVLAALGRVIDPEIRRPVTELDMIRGVDVQPGGAVRVDLQLTIVGAPPPTPSSATCASPPVRWTGCRRSTSTCR
ncbi:iron-sulfur cluster assembly protein [Sphingomonas sp. LR61]|uniref:iron-sulfur cluster assembly protein n=1 Tax=Sphingomonas sp. LR61 TaxID=3050234 RepID=UPI003FA7DED5